jgi:hypothetical protein
MWLCYAQPSVCFERVRKNFSDEVHQSGQIQIQVMNSTASITCAFRWILLQEQRYLALPKNMLRNGTGHSTVVPVTPRKRSALQPAILL